MTETIVVLVVLAAATAAALLLRTYHRFMRARDRLVTHVHTTAPDIAVRHPTDTGFVADVLGAGVDVDLASLLRVRPAGVPEAEWFDEIIDRIRAQVPAPRPAPFALVQDRIMPLLRPMTYIALFERYPPALRLAWRSFAEDVAVTYAITAVDQRTIVTRGMLEAWAQSVDTVHTLAVENLRRQTAHVLEEIGGRRLRYEHLDGFDATRILVADLIVPQGLEDPLVAIPEETALLVAPASQRDSLQAEATSRHAASTRPLTPTLFRLSDWTQGTDRRVTNATQDPVWGGGSTGERSTGR